MRSIISQNIISKMISEQNKIYSRKSFLREKRIQNATVIGVHFTSEEHPVIRFKNSLSRMHKTWFRISRAVQYLSCVLVRRGHDDEAIYHGESITPADEGNIKPVRFEFKKTMMMGSD